MMVLASFGGSPEPLTQISIPSLWCNANTEEAVRFYTSVIANTRVVSEMQRGDQSTGMAREHPDDLAALETVGWG